MTTPLHSYRRRRPALLALTAALLVGMTSRAQDPGPDGAQSKRVGQFFTVRLPITDRTISEIQSQAQPFVKRSLERGVEPVLIFEFLPGEEIARPTSYFNAAELANILSLELTRAEQTIAFVPEPIQGYGVLPILACDEVVMAPKSSLGPIATGDAPVSEAVQTVENLARRKGRDPSLLLGMLQPDRNLREVQTADRRKQFVFQDEMGAFRRGNEVLQDVDTWAAGKRGVLTADHARDLRFTKLLAEDRRAVAQEFGLASAADDPTLGSSPVPLLINIDGPIDAVKEGYVKNRLGRAIGRDKVNLIIVHLNSEGGQVEPASAIARALGSLKSQGVKTVAYVDRALGMATLVALGCDEIIMDEDAEIGDMTVTVEGRGDVNPVDERMLVVIRDEARDLAREKFHPEWIAAAMVDRDLELVKAKDHQSEGGQVYLPLEIAQADQERFEILGTVKSAGADPLKLGAEPAERLGLAQGSAQSVADWMKAQGLQNVRTDRPTWVDSLVTTLNTPWMSWLLLFIGMFMLILELKLPGVGLPAITSALAFLLFFWGHYLGGTADRLEIMLFLVGLICLALELFVFPGFGVFGVSGILLVLISVVMASHTFIWPTQEYEYRQMGRTLTQVTLMIVAVVAAAIVLGRYFPSMPLFRRMILVPEPADGSFEDLTSKQAIADSESSLFFLVGETGRTTTVCRPSGKARIGEMLVDVTADGMFIEADSMVEVVEVRGSRVFVKRVG